MTPVESPGPAEEYARRLEGRRTEADALAREDRKIADLRVALFVLALAVLSAGLLAGWFSAWWALLPAVAFAALLIRHDGVIRRRERAERAFRFYEAGVERLTDRWAGRGVSGEGFRDPGHPYAEDLDLFGKGSLFELLCTARTRAGEETLARWLLAPAPPETARARQVAVDDLRPRLDFREEIELLGEEVRAEVRPETVVGWGTAPPVGLRGRGARPAATMLAAITVAAAGAWAAGFGFLPFGVMLLAETALLLSLWGRVQQALHAADEPARELALFSHLLQRVEAAKFEASLLRELQAGLGSDGLSPSASLARLDRLMSMVHAQHNGAFALVGLILLWPVHLAVAIEEWRAAHGKELGAWLAAVGEFEALSALATYAYEHPLDPFPEILDGGSSLEGEGLGHPLIPEAASVRNDVTLGPERRLLVVSGSNMSGKSTLLRTLGTNTVLALAGAPVRARRLRLSPLAVGASIRTQDSLQEGTSRFYAEITRLRHIVALADGDRPLLFLLDEILHGTNSHDRRIGAEAVVRTLVRKGAVGLVTTHDLALTRIVEDPALRAANVHFQDHLEDGTMVFDYRLRPGVVEKSNALDLMRAVGLEV
jgi:hypothetical protein